MGIQGLIPFLEKISQPTNVSDYSGGVVAVDAYCWLHKGAFSCADKLSRGEPCLSYVHYCMKYVNMLLSYNIKPILVFDGQRLPAKSDTEKKRREARELNRKKAAELLRLDRGKEAQMYLRRSIDITHEMALNLIRECRSRNIDCIVAPYEADAQLAYLSINDIVDVVITEDSDLLLFGAKKVLFKMDTNGLGLLIEQEKLHVSMDVKPEQFSFDKFLYMCMLSGCDYLPSIPGIGLIKARKFIKRTADPDIHRVISRMPSYLNMPQLIVPLEYRDNFVAAEATFKYQPVFDPLTRSIVPLNHLPKDISRIPDYLINVPLTSDQAIQLMYGNLDPFSLKQVDNWDPDESQPAQYCKTNKWKDATIAPHCSIWSKNYMELKSQPYKKPEPPNALCRTSTCGKRIIQKVSIEPITNMKSEEIFDESENKSLEKLLHTYQLPLNDQSNKHKQIADNFDDNEDIDEGFCSAPKRFDNTPSPRKSNYESVKENLNNLSRCTKNQQRTLIDSSCNVISRYFTSDDSEGMKSSKLENNNVSDNLELKLAKIEESIEMDNGSFSSPILTENSLNLPNSPLKKLCKKLDNDFATQNCPQDNNEPASPIITSIKRRNPFHVDKLNTTNDTNPRIQGMFKWKEELRNKYGFENIVATPSAKQEFKSPIRLCDTSNKTQSDKEPIKDEDVAKKLNEETDEEDEGFFSPTLHINKSNALKPSNARSIKQCRPVGLAKKVTTVPKQQTLLSMFSFRKPEKLKL